MICKRCHHSVTASNVCPKCFRCLDCCRCEEEVVEQAEQDELGIVASDFDADEMGIDTEEEEDF